ncbi:hypothetical protein LCM4579_22075 [Ensifer sp. LCM 4579]|nr:hypothetical protein LCM4579_22075 [Ensifer sp. LCM 4579]
MEAKAAEAWPGQSQSWSVDVGIERDEQARIWLCMDGHRRGLVLVLFLAAGAISAVSANDRALFVLNRR